jgi:hypothetical protein
VHLEQLPEALCQILQQVVEAFWVPQQQQQVQTVLREYRHQLSFEPFTNESQLGCFTGFVDSPEVVLGVWPQVS